MKTYKEKGYNENVVKELIRRNMEEQYKVIRDKTKT